jgi:hypothetical protein
MAEIATKHRPVVKTPTTYRRGTPEARVASVVDRSAELSDGVLKSLEASERAALEAVGQFVITIEEALPQEVASTSDVRFVFCGTAPSTHRQLRCRPAQARDWRHGDSSHKRRQDRIRLRGERIAPGLRSSAPYRRRSGNGGWLDRSVLRVGNE